MSPLAPAALALALVHLAACGSSATPTESTPTAAPTPAASAPEPAPKLEKVRTPDGKAGLIPMTRGPRPAPEPPLTQEEIDLIAADPATLTPEMRVKRAHAVRRKILQNPDSPAARQLEALRLAAQNGDIKPQLPASDLVFHTPAPPPAPAAPAPAAPAP